MELGTLKYLHRETIKKSVDESGCGSKMIRMCTFAHLMVVGSYPSHMPLTQPHVVRHHVFLMSCDDLGISLRLVHRIQADDGPVCTMSIKLKNQSKLPEEKEIALGD